MRGVLKSLMICFINVYGNHFFSRLKTVPLVISWLILSDPQNKSADKPWTA